MCPVHAGAWAPLPRLSDDDIDRIATRVADFLEARAEQRRLAEARERAKGRCVGCETGMPLYADQRGHLMHSPSGSGVDSDRHFACNTKRDAEEP